MRLIKTATLAALLLNLVACSPPSASKPDQVATKRPAPTGEEESLSRTCALTAKGLVGVIDSCNCGDVAAAGDTISVELMPSDGGEIQGRVLKLRQPVCDGSWVLLMQHQNRYYTSSMGPDPVLTDWLLYTSPVDTIRFDPRLPGFRIGTIAQVEQARFPKFDTLSFYRAYQRAVGDSLRSVAVPGNAKGARHEEYIRYQTAARELLQVSSAELHRVILVLKKGRRVEKVLLFTYGHFG